MRTGPSRLTSTAWFSGESKLTVAAEWITTSQLAKIARSSGERPRPSVDTSPATVVMRRAQCSSNGLAPPSCWRSRSNASLRRISRCTRVAAVVRLPGRTSSTSSQSGTERSSRSTIAVPRKPVDPVTAMRLPASAWAITRRLSTIW